MSKFLTNENINMPNMIYGTAWKKELTDSFVYEALKSGFKGIDTACQPKHYREDLVGIGLKKAFDENIKRKDIIIQTKFTPIDGQDINNMPYDKNDILEEQVKKSFLKSKENLGVDFIDSYILHSPVFPISNLLIVWKKMEEFYYNREVGQLGISNCYDLGLLQYLYENSSIKPAIVQNRFYNHTNYDKDIRSWCLQNGIIYESFWSLTANPHILNSDIMENLTKKYNKTSEQIFYKFLNQINILPLNGTTSKEHMILDLDINSFDLESDDIDLISGVL